MEISEELRQRVDEAVERWTKFLSVDQLIEEIIDEIDTQKDANRKEKMKGFAVQREKQTSIVYATIFLQKEESPSFSTVRELGKCDRTVFKEIAQVWGENAKLRVMPKEAEKTYTYIVTFV